MAGQTGHQDIARRYASAFFALAKEEGQLDHVAKDLQALRKIMTESKDFQAFIGNAALPRAAQAKALAAIGDKAHFCGITKKFLGTLAMKRRIDVLPEIVAAAEAELARHHGEITAEVTSAHALDAKQIETIAASLKKILGLTVKVEAKQDAEIMGGLVIRVGSKLIDSSVRAKLERLHRSLKSSNTSGNKNQMREVA